MTFPNDAFVPRFFEYPQFRGDPESPSDVQTWTEAFVQANMGYLEDLSGGIYGQRGSWEPVAEGATTAGDTVTYDTQIGTYVAVGSLCWITASLEWDDANHNGTGDLIITGLPYTSDDTSGADQLIPIYDFESGGVFFGIGVISPDTKQIGAIYDGSGNLQSVEANHTLLLTGVYRINGD